MTEVDIINSLMFCEHGDCENCSRDGKDRYLCMKGLMKDARSIIKLQYDSLSAMEDTIKRLQNENKQLQDVAKYELTEQELVKAVNNIIRDCVDYANDGDGDDFARMIDTLLEFTKMLTAKHAVGIIHGRKAPKIEKC